MVFVVFAAGGDTSVVFMVFAAGGDTSVLFVVFAAGGDMSVVFVVFAGDDAGELPPPDASNGGGGESDGGGFAGASYTTTDPELPVPPNATRLPSPDSDIEDIPNPAQPSTVGASMT